MAWIVIYTMPSGDCDVGPRSVLAMTERAFDDDAHARKVLSMTCTPINSGPPSMSRVRSVISLAR